MKCTGGTFVDIIGIRIFVMNEFQYAYRKLEIGEILLTFNHLMILKNRTPRYFVPLVYNVSETLTDIIHQVLNCMLSFVKGRYIFFTTKL